MIKYKLTCENCRLSFDSWFASSKEYEKLKKRKLLDCSNCNSRNIKKTLMAPKVLNKNIERSHNQIKKFKKINNKIKEYQNFIKKNFEYVGNNFTQEATPVYYDNKKRVKGIYGNASLKDIRELKEEGINTQVVPWVDDKSN